MIQPPASLPPEAAEYLANEPYSPFNSALGLEFVEWAPDYARVDLPIRPDHLNRSGIIHGGVLLTLLDVTCGFAGLYPLEGGQRRFGVTLSIATHFIGQAAGDRLIATAHRRGGGNAIYFAAGEVHDTAGTLVATAEGTFRYRKAYVPPTA